VNFSASCICGNAWRIFPKSGESALWFGMRRFVEMAREDGQLPRAQVAHRRTEQALRLRGEAEQQAGDRVAGIAAGEGEVAGRTSGRDLDVTSRCPGRPGGDLSSDVAAVCSRAGGAGSQ
jgi:hypothetical protein